MSNMCQTAMSPDTARIANVAAQSINPAWDQSNTIRSSYRSTTTPPNKPKAARGPNSYRTKMPTIDAEWVNSSTSQAWTVFWIQKPIDTMKPPRKYSRY